MLVYGVKRGAKAVADDGDGDGDGDGLGEGLPPVTVTLTDPYRHPDPYRTGGGYEM